MGLTEAEAAGWETTRIPVALLHPYIERFLRAKGMKLSTLQRHLGLNGTEWGKLGLTAEGEGLLVDASKRVGFDLADKIICFVSHPFLWHCDGDLHFVYQRVNLKFLDKRQGRKVRVGGGVFRCAGPGCTKTFTPHKNTGKQKYCSNACRTNAYRVRHDKVKTRSRGPRRHLENYTCVQGHERSPENTAYDKNGSRRCRVCRRTWNAQWRAKKKA